MSSLDSETPTDWRLLGRLESDIQVRIRAVEGELARVECLDEEERAEIHAILQALKHDSEANASILGTYISEARDA